MCMQNNFLFALLQKHTAGPSLDQLKRVFKQFSHLTDADAVRLSVGAHGILMKNLEQQPARALQIAFQKEGTPVLMIAQRDLPALPEKKFLHRAEIWPQALTICDPGGATAAIPWNDVTLIAAGAAQDIDRNRTQTEMLRRHLDANSDILSKSPPDALSDSRLILEFIVRDGEVRYEIDAAEFMFKQVIDRPGLGLEEKFIWLVRQICREAAQASLNSGARSLVDGAQRVPRYANRQLFTDEIVWLLWRARQVRKSS